MEQGSRHWREKKSIYLSIFLTQGKKKKITSGSTLSLSTKLLKDHVATGKKEITTIITREEKKEAVLHKSDAMTERICESQRISAILLSNSSGYPMLPKDGFSNWWMEPWQGRSIEKKKKKKDCQRNTRVRLWAPPGLGKI